MIFLDHVPLLRAVKMAKLMADLLDADVIVVDPLGIWHEWLVEWACTPVGDAALPTAPLGVIASRPDAVVPRAPQHGAM
jgi:hypothetical protein